MATENPTARVPAVDLKRFVGALVAVAGIIACAVLAPQLVDENALLIAGVIGLAATTALRGFATD